jgi:site-specific DNA-methyltransferase (adenine-specific)
VAANVVEHGTGAINIDDCRIGYKTGEVDFDRKQQQQQSDGTIKGAFGAAALIGSKIQTYKAAGRWPANVILDEEAGRLLDEQSGVSTSGAAGSKGASGFADGYDGGYSVPYGDTGGASRFFYCAKASKADRNAGLDWFEVKRPDNGSKTGMGTFDEKGVAAQQNHHPTVKPIDLMRYLVRLVTPKGGTVLDPFNGSGTTGIAAVLEGFQYVGIEQNAEYVKIADARIYFWSKDQQMDLGLAS